MVNEQPRDNFEPIGLPARQSGLGRLIEIGSQPSRQTTVEVEWEQPNSGLKSKELGNRL
jgi:hypothetical protein